MADLTDPDIRAFRRDMGADRAEEVGTRNGVPGEFLVRLRPAEVVAARHVTA